MASNSNPKKRNLTLFLLGLLTASSAVANAPPNTLDSASLNRLNQQAYYAAGQIPSPAQQAPLSMQPLLVPNMQSQIQQEINSYKSEQLSGLQMQDLKKFEEGRLKVESLPYSSAPMPVNRSIAVNLAPDAPLTTIRLAKNMLTSIAFTDEDGTPWEVEKISVNAQLFTNHTEQPGLTTPVAQNTQQQATPTQRTVKEVQNPDGTVTREEIETPIVTETKTTSQQVQPLPATSRANNIVSLEPNTLFGYSNLVVTLKGKANPLVFILTTGQLEVDMLVSARVGGVNPDRKYNPLSGSRVSNETVLDENVLQFLDGRTPSAATELMSSDGAVQAWELNDKLFIKTRLDVMYPAYTAKASMDGVSVYRFDSMSKTKMVTLTQRAGQPVNVQFQQTPYYLR